MKGGPCTAAQPCGVPSASTGGEEGPLAWNARKLSSGASSRVGSPSLASFLFAWGHSPAKGCAAALGIRTAPASQEAALRALSEVRFSRPFQRHDCTEGAGEVSRLFFFLRNAKPNCTDRQRSLSTCGKETTPFPPADCTPTTVDSPQARGKSRIA